MAYVGIDQSYTGFAVTVLNASTLEHNTVLGKFEAAKYPHEVDRLLAIEEFLLSSLSYWVVDAICMEGYANGAKFGREKAGELGYAVKRALRKRPVQALTPVIVPPTSVKKFVTGSGTAKKSEMLLGVYKRWGVEFKDDNKADSYALARIAQALGDPDIPLTQYQQDVLNKLQ